MSVKPYDIGGLLYGPHEANELRMALIASRNDALDPETFNSRLAVELTHTIGLLHALMLDKWPEYATLAQMYEKLKGERPDKYGEAISKEAALASIGAVAPDFKAVLDRYLENPTPENRQALSNDINQIRITLDAIEQGEDA
jgi:hypothetical protein